ncbi:hypothetical protein HPB49_020957 [Dermacentor silvarum]|uniref:Uncharacterized protein n=1 Tax=Dermacentor silvarum TaxID=543639 RepID=A0ACB8DFS2_DERSI|nr:hypothetical protein HPB49_020957 [Dermacentor silvarum]
MGDGGPPRPPDKASPAAVALSVGNRDITDYRLPDSSDSSTAAEMESDSDYTLVQSRHLKRKLRRTSAGSDSTHKSRCDERVFSVGYTPTTAGTNLNSLNRQSLTKFFDRIASGHVREIRINARKNILTVDVSSQAVLEALKSIEVVGNIPVRSFLAYGNDTCTGVVSDVDIDIKDEDLRSLLSSTKHPLAQHKHARCAGAAAYKTPPPRIRGENVVDRITANPRRTATSRSAEHLAQECLTRTGCSTTCWLVEPPSMTRSLQILYPFTSSHPRTEVLPASMMAHPATVTLLVSWARPMYIE